MEDLSQSRDMFFANRFNSGRLSVTDVEHTTMERQQSSVSIFSSNDVKLKIITSEIPVFIIRFF